MVKLVYTTLSLRWRFFNVCLSSLEISVCRRGTYICEFYAHAVGAIFPEESK